MGQIIFNSFYMNNFFNLMVFLMAEMLIFSTITIMTEKKKTILAGSFGIVSFQTLVSAMTIIINGNPFK